MASNFLKVDKILDHIRITYDSILDHLPTAAYLKRAFEDRYLDALKGKTDLEFFLKGEQSFVEGFLEEAAQERKRKEAYKDRNKDGFAENILEELRAGITSYPALASLDEKCIREVSLLYGAIQQFIREYWDGIAYYARGVGAATGVEIDRMERSLPDVYSATENHPPKAVELYNEMVCNQAGTSAERVRTAQDAIQFAGIWLNNVRQMLEQSNHSSGESYPPNISAALDKLGRLIEDFRLQAFRKRKN